MSHTPEPWKVLNDSELTPADVWIVPIYHETELAEAKNPKKKNQGPGKLSSKWIR